MIVLFTALFLRSIKQSVQRIYQDRRYRKDLQNGLAINISIAATGGNFGFLDRWAGSVSLPRRSILVAGASGSGKTEVAIHFVQQMLFDHSSLMLVYDHKTDFQDFFDILGVEYISISMEDSTYIWNLFREFDTEQDIDEFAQALFPEPSGGENDFFDDMARQVFAACLKRLVRKREESDEFELSNASVRHYFQRNGADEIYEHLSEYSDLRAAASAIDVETSPKQAQGVYASVQRIVNKVFIGDFGAAPPDGDGFSIRDHVRDPQGVPIVLDFPKATGQSTKPIFRFLIDHTAKHAMQNTDTYSYFILDEFAQIPHLRQLEELVNVGRGDKVVTLVTLQSVQQLYQNYGRNGGESILAGLVSMVLLRPNDSETAEFYRDAIGTKFVQHTNYVEEKWYGKRKEMKQSEQHIFATGDIRKWDPGVGVIVKQAGWFFGYISMLTGDTMEVIADVLSPTEHAGALPERSITGEIEGTASSENQDESDASSEQHVGTD
nr:type IV secretion system DNA-binding domain-containing protein [Halocatena marina]